MKTNKTIFSLLGCYLLLFLSNVSAYTISGAVTWNAGPIGSTGCVPMSLFSSSIDIQLNSSLTIMPGAIVRMLGSGTTINLLGPGSKLVVNGVITNNIGSSPGGVWGGVILYGNGSPHSSVN